VKSFQKTAQLQKSVHPTYEKGCEIQGGGQEMAVRLIIKKFNHDNSGEFDAKS